LFSTKSTSVVDIIAFIASFFHQSNSSSYFCTTQQTWVFGTAWHWSS